MYQTAAILAAFLLIYSAVAGRVERSWLSGPIVFTAVGLLLGRNGLGIVRLDLGAEGLRTLAELTLAMVLFTDAANADFDIVRRHIGVPERLLLIGLPLTIVLGFLVALVLYPRLAPLEIALLATILAPTDAALGKPVVTNPGVPAVMREALNIESGLNDGICVPVVVLLLGLAVDIQIEHATVIHAIRVVAEELGIGAAVGLAATWLTVLILRFAERKGWVSEHWEEVPIVGLAAACFAAAQATGGSGFIACFVGGLLLNGLRPQNKRGLLRGAIATGEAMALLTWIAFGIGALAQIIGRLSWTAALYAVLSLTLIRTLPVVLCLAGTGMRTADKLFIAWFGPRGLATIVFGVIVLNERLPGNDTIIAVAGFTVLLSVIAHGVSANPLVKAIAARNLAASEEVRGSTVSR
jgi:NhaP-type Na+/H+ or K+/H+ antiporter